MQDVPYPVLAFRTVQDVAAEHGTAYTMAPRLPLLLLLLLLLLVLLLLVLLLLLLLLLSSLSPRSGVPSASW